MRNGDQLGPIPRGRCLYTALAGSEGTVDQDAMPVQNGGGSRPQFLSSSGGGCGWTTGPMGSGSAV
jgi:hypothetical protein